jgi:hypothetical protein
MGVMKAPDQPCPGCGGVLYRESLGQTDITDRGLRQPVPGKAVSCSGGCDFTDAEDITGELTPVPRRL